MNTPDAAARRGVLSAGGFITDSDSGAAIGRCKPGLPLRQGWAPAGQRQPAGSVHDQPARRGRPDKTEITRKKEHSENKQV
ncbi:hypothetical protein [Rahnella bonaserana]